MDPVSLKVIAPSRYSTPKQLVLATCCNAAGYTIPPLVMFNHKTLKPEMTVGEVPRTMYGLFSSGWTDTELFELWFTHHFLTHAPPVCPLLLLLDGHLSHFQPSFAGRAAEEQVIVFCLPPLAARMLSSTQKSGNKVLIFSTLLKSVDAWHEYEQHNCRFLPIAKIISMSTY